MDLDAGPYRRTDNGLHTAVGPVGYGICAKKNEFCDDRRIAHANCNECFAKLGG